MSKHLLAIDQGTTGSTALVLDRDGKTIGRTTTEFPQHFPQPGWVSHDTREIWANYFLPQHRSRILQQLADYTRQVPDETARADIVAFAAALQAVN